MHLELRALSKDLESVENDITFKTPSERRLEKKKTDDLRRLFNSVIAFLQLLIGDLHRRKELIPIEEQLSLRAERLGKVATLKRLSIVILHLYVK